MTGVTPATVVADPGQLSLHSGQLPRHMRWYRSALPLWRGEELAEALNGG